ncbi:MAG: hypothetical protein V1847_01405 [Candidatus Diapherotrites archaeon]
MTEFPESQLVHRSLTLREMDLPPSVKLTKRSLLRWWALSLGLISEKESRSMVLDVLDALFYFQYSKKIDPSVQEILKYVKEKSGKKTSQRLVCYHLNRLMEWNLIVLKGNKYYFNSAPSAERKDLKATLQHFVEKPMQEQWKQVEEVSERLQNSYAK